jgi:hypothetical protein
MNPLFAPSSHRCLVAAALVLLTLAVAPGRLESPALAQAPAPSFTEALFKSLQFRALGPAIMGGRIDDVAVVESNPHIIYVATASGGLWRTSNNGTTWEPLFDQQSHSSIGDVTVAPSNPELVWVGTGEANNRQSSSWGNGVYKSTDGGKTWEHMGLKDSHHIGRIVIHPTNPDLVYVAAAGHLWGPNKERGLFKTTDGGKTWTNTKFINEDTGFIDVALDPNEPDTLYAAAYQRRRTPFGFQGGGPGSALYKTTDGGATWKKLMEGLPVGDAGRIGIDIWRKDTKSRMSTLPKAASTAPMTKGQPGGRCRPSIRARCITANCALTRRTTSVSTCSAPPGMFQITAAEALCPCGSPSMAITTHSGSIRPIPTT